MRSRTVNWEEAAAALVERVRHEIARELGSERRERLEALIGEAGRLERGVQPGMSLPVLSLQLRRENEAISLLTTVTTLGTPLDITADELHIESYFPADATSERLLRQLAASPARDEH